jgi:hypothetical protein
VCRKGVVVWGGGGWVEIYLGREHCVEKISL